MSYRVKTVSQLTGIPRPTLVAWERRYDLLGPRRSEAGYRIYEEADVAYLKALKRLVDEGVAISEAITRVPRPGAAPAPEPGDPVTTLLDHLVAFDRDGAAPSLRRVEQMPFAEALTELWEPLLLELGRRWESGEVSVAQEHYVSGVAREAFVAMLRSVGHGPGKGPRAVCATLPDERHDLPLLSVSVQLALAGWRITWLGADVPLPDLCAHVVARAPDVVCLSAIVVDREDVASAGRTVLAAAPRATTVVVGGPAADALREREGPRLWVCADAADLLSRWVGSTPG